MCEFFLYLRKKDVSDSIILGITLFCGLNVRNFIHLNTIWKDIPYTLSLLWAFILIAKPAIVFDEYKNRSLYPAMSAATAYTANTQWIAAIEWRCGTFLLLAIIAVATLIMRLGFDKRLVIIAPPIGHIMSLLLTIRRSDFRYF